ncbi:MAG: 1-(5-phosphoribosyl)-5-amino-4-imidazole-carboxylate carboxylase [Elusimicrobia bacterium HGW-Elusimicrobia-1]|jgi:hypothetical protein|nr:MAG: 1-(5-phosphoribosyl)-5-amino-4-imidazole-carboxylate carboxylase [Elusimicrobia bacterium HGW-Elusimicrobia-1]
MKLPDKSLSFACPDVNRFARQGIPEAVYCPGKTVAQIAAIVRAFAAGGRCAAPVILTRADGKIFRAVRGVIPSARWHEAARMVTAFPRRVPAGGAYAAIVTAGTTDIPVAEEAAVTAETLGAAVRRAYDVGVAGVHRVIEKRGLIEGASAVIVCAGMEGALPSVVGGLARSPVIGVPTSVGYGANFGGLAALLAMLNSCAPNVCVVNIDDGFGAGVIVSLIAAKNVNGRK